MLVKPKDDKRFGCNRAVSVDCLPGYSHLPSMWDCPLDGFAAAELLEKARPNRFLWTFQLNYLISCVKWQRRCPSICRCFAICAHLHSFPVIEQRKMSTTWALCMIPSSSNQWTGATVTEEEGDTITASASLALEARMHRNVTCFLFRVRPSVTTRMIKVSGRIITVSGSGLRNATEHCTADGPGPHQLNRTWRGRGRCAHIRQNYWKGNIFGRQSQNILRKIQCPVDVHAWEAGISVALCICLPNVLP